MIKPVFIRYKNYVISQTARTIYIGEWIGSKVKPTRLLKFQKLSSLNYENVVQAEKAIDQHLKDAIQVKA